jgi:organic hydroperoxide reductase OsmC/OhrA
MLRKPIFKITTIACFLGALQAAAAKQGKREVGARAVVHADVSLGLAADRPGFGLKVVLRVEGVEDQAILDAAHEVSYVIQSSQPLELMDLFLNRHVHTAALCAMASW